MTGRGLSAFSMRFPAPRPELGIAVPRGGNRVPTEGLGPTVPGGPGRFGLQGEGQSRGRGRRTRSVLAAEGWPEARAVFEERGRGCSAARPRTDLPRAVPDRGPAATALLPSTPGPCPRAPPGAGLRRLKPQSGTPGPCCRSRLGKWAASLELGRGSAAPRPRSRCVPRGAPAPAAGPEGSGPEPAGTGTFERHLKGF